MIVSNQTIYRLDQKVEYAAITVVFNLRDILELVRSRGEKRKSYASYQMSIPSGTYKN